MDDRSLVSEMISTMHKFHRLNRKVFAVEELSSAEFCMLRSIAAAFRRKQEEGIEEQGVSSGELIREREMSAAAASKFLRNLEQKGYIIRENSNTDRRVSYIRLTAKGDRLLKADMKKHDRIMKRVMEQMGEERMGQFVENLSLLYEYIKQELEEEEKDV
ncbi:MAG: winged helix DNA-binding protein [Clostridiales bacterium]|nr:winged helix DNA-binding protein [Clostridiales bacterium]